MKILIVNTSECTGGAAIAARRLMKSLDNAGVDTKMLVLHKVSTSDRVISIGSVWQKKVSFIWERIVIWINNLFTRKNLFTISIANTGFDITRLSEFKQADVIHLHWINQGMLSLEDIRKVIRSGKPVVWTMHDMWECTSICHHAHTCERYKDECRYCPFLRFPGKKDISNRVFRKKQSIYQSTPIEIITVSNWLADRVRQSALLKNKNISVIPNTLSLDDFVLMDKQKCREELALPDKQILLFGAARIDDPIKGFNTLIQAIHCLIQQNKFRTDELHLILFGKIKYPQEVLPSIPISYSDFGWITDTTLLSKLYAAADVTVSASLYETFGQTLIEAQACGCLPVSFGNSGQADIIIHKKNGFLSQYQSAESLAEGIVWCITEGSKNISKEDIRNHVLRRYSGEVIAAQYIELYKNLTEKKRS